MAARSGIETAVARMAGVSLRYGTTQALDSIDLEVPAGRMVGLIGPDGVGKSSLLALVAGARSIQRGWVEVLGGDMAQAGHRARVCPHIAYMPQGLGKNLYPTLSVEENLQFFGRLFGHGAAERRRRIDELTGATGLFSFLGRPAGKLSGGMKQKLGLCCALIHDPDLLVLDEPTTGVDPLARSQFWDLIGRIRAQRPEMSVLVATAYMEEAEQFDWLVALDAGRILSVGTPAELRTHTASDSLEAAFIALLPEERRQGHRPVVVEPLIGEEGEIAIEAQALTRRFGDFTAVDRVSFRIRRGEIFGFLGSNGCGKTTTMKMLTGLLPATSGQAWLFGREVDSRDLASRRRVGYMSQSFSLYAELTVAQNLVLHARLFQVPEAEIPDRVVAMVHRFGLAGMLDALPETLPLGQRQRLSLAVAMIHRPELLILDEPTSGVDPIARDAFWQLMIEMARRDRVTIFISTHFMNEADRCDRISLMHAGRVLVSDTPAALRRHKEAASLEAAFIGYLQEAGVQDEREQSMVAERPPAIPGGNASHRPRASTPGRWFSLGRACSYTLRETLELRRDPVRLTLALLGTVMLLFIMGYGISMDVQDLRFAVLDRDQTGLSCNYALSLAGSRYFVERPAIADYAELDLRMRSGELSLAIEIPPGFGRDVQRGNRVELGGWIDGAMPQRAETVRGYVQGIHQNWLTEMARARLGQTVSAPATVETRYRYNPDVKSLPAMVPAVIPLLLLMIPAMLTALSVVREKELGSILNLYVTPVSRSEFLLGKLMPYLFLTMFNFFLLTLLAVTVFGVPLKGSFATLTLATSIYALFATGFGLFASVFTRSQIAAIFATMVGTILPTVQFAGMINPVSSLEGAGRFLGEVYPATHMLIISRGIFSKALGFVDLTEPMWRMSVAVPIILGLSVLLLKKQER